LAIQPVGKKAENARDQSGGLIDSVSDEEILDAYKLLASEEGIFAEPASAASVAGVIKLAKTDYFKPDSKVVCILTGNGLKDPDTAIKVGEEPKVIPADIKAVMKVIGE